MNFRSTARLPLLDGLRGIAALSVMGYHAENLFFGHGPFARSYLLVDLFFLLSGFVLGLSAEPKLREGWGWQKFMEARWRRLWPMIAIGAAIGAISFATFNDPRTTLFCLALSLLMFPTLFTSKDTFPLNGPQWSLLVELIANLAHGTLLARLSTRNLVWICGVAGVLLSARIFELGANDFAGGGVDWKLAFIRIGFGYTFGVILARWHRSGTPPPLARPYWNWPLMLAVIPVLALPYLPLDHALGDAVVTLVVFPLAFAWCSVTDLPKSLSPAFSALGRLSYPLYAVHIPVMLLFFLIGRTASIGVLAVLTAITVAAVLAALLERPRRIPAGQLRAIA